MTADKINAVQALIGTLSVVLTEAEDAREKYEIKLIEAQMLSRQIDDALNEPKKWSITFPLSGNEADAQYDDGPTSPAWVQGKLAGEPIVGDVEQVPSNPNTFTVFSRFEPSPITVRIKRYDSGSSTWGEPEEQTIPWSQV